MKGGEEHLIVLWRKRGNKIEKKGRMFSGAFLKLLRYLLIVSPFFITLSTCKSFHFIENRDTKRHLLNKFFFLNRYVFSQIFRIK
jgi:hypothetical protein